MIPRTIKGTMYWSLIDQTYNTNAELKYIWIYKNIANERYTVLLDIAALNILSWFSVAVVAVVVVVAVVAAAGGGEVGVKTVAEENTLTST